MKNIWKLAACQQRTSWRTTNPICKKEKEKGLLVLILLVGWANADAPWGVCDSLGMLLPGSSARTGLDFFFLEFEPLLTLSYACAVTNFLFLLDLRRVRDGPWSSPGFLGGDSLGLKNTRFSPSTSSFIASQASSCFDMPKTNTLLAHIPAETTHNGHWASG